METCLYQKTFIVLGIWCKKHYNSSLNKWKFYNMETESKDKTKTLTENVYVSFNFVSYHTCCITISFHCLFISSDRYY